MILAATLFMSLNAFVWQPAAAEIESIQHWCLMLWWGLWITGFIWKGKGVEKSAERTFEQFHKRLFYRILARTTQHRMFQNVGDPGRVGRRGTKIDSEDFILIFVYQRKHVGPRMMLVAQHPGAQFDDFRFLYEFEAAFVHWPFSIVNFTRYTQCYKQSYNVL